MVQTAAHLVDHVIPHVPVRQWVLSLPIPLRLLRRQQRLQPAGLYRRLAFGRHKAPSGPLCPASPCTLPCAARPTTARRWSNCAATSPARLWPTNAYKPTLPGKSC